MADATKILSVLKLKKRSDKGTSLEDERNLLALCSLLTLGVSSLALLVAFLALMGVNTIASKPTPTLVQTLNGKAMSIASLQNKERPPKVIQDFVLKNMTDLFTWRVYLLPTTQDEFRNPKVDPGMPIEVEGNASLKLPTPVWAASFAISDDFRKDFLGKSLAPLTTSLKILQGSSYVAFMPISIQEPVEVKGKSEEKLWRVKVVGNLAIRTAQNVPETIVPINKDIYVRAIVPPILPDLEKVDSKTDLQAVTAIARSYGLEIYGMEDFSRDDLTK